MMLISAKLKLGSHWAGLCLTISIKGVRFVALSESFNLKSFAPIVKTNLDKASLNPGFQMTPPKTKISCPMKNLSLVVTMGFIIKLIIKFQTAVDTILLLLLHP